MKILFLSDIHGISLNLPYIEDLIKKENFEKIVVLGDLLYNYSSLQTDVDGVDNFLNKHKNKLILVRGNCDLNENLNLMEIIKVDNLDIYCTHGHVYNEDNFEPTGVLIYGHFHYPYIIKKEKTFYINTGSISLPRKKYPPTYTIYDNREFTIYGIDGDIIDSIKV